MAETKKKNSGSLPVGTILRNGQYQYRIGEVLGQGNYGITYKASAKVKIGNISKPMTFAVKENFAKDYCSRMADGVTLRYAEEHAEEAERDLREFIAEGKTLERICHGHENIVNVDETFEENNTAYYVMEFIEGGDLQSLVRSKGRLTETESISIISPVIDAVAHIHRNRRLHLDIKPENIVLKKDGTPILIDFGITLHFNADGSRSGTSKDKSGGLSEGYAPLEQYAGVNSFAPEIDIYALGATLYYMLVGKDPDKAGEINSRRIDANLPENISQQTRTAILHAMNKLAEDRTQTAEELKKELNIGTRNADSYKLTIKYNGNGTVSRDNKTLKNGTTYQIKNNSSKTLTIIPDVGHEIEYVKLNNKDVTYQLNGNTLELTRQEQDVTLTIGFTEKSGTSYFGIKNVTINSSGKGKIKADVLDSIIVRDSSRTFSVDLGASFVIHIMPDKGYRIKSLKVNGTYASSKVQNNIYIVKNVSKDTIIDVEFDEEEIVAPDAEKPVLNIFTKVIIGVFIAIGALVLYYSIGYEKNDNKHNGDYIIKQIIDNMVYVEGGTFIMGATSEQDKDASDAEKPTHQVTLSSFSIGKFEVTQEEWIAVMGSNPSFFKDDKRPVEKVTWNDCQEFIDKLNKITGKQFRLPTEAEWEYAARGGNKCKGYKFAGGNDLIQVAWCEENSNSSTHTVGEKFPNELGIYDMSGNVWEWCQDWYSTYNTNSENNPKGPSSGFLRVRRGGGWERDHWKYKYDEKRFETFPDIPCRCWRVSYRSADDPDEKSWEVGFRLAL